MTYQTPLTISLFQHVKRLVLPCLLIATALYTTPAQAALSTDTNVPYYTDLSLNEQSAIQTRYNALKTEITKAKSKATDIRIRLNAGETTVTEADYTKAVKEVTVLEEAATAIYAYIHELDGTTGNNTGTGSNSGSNTNTGTSTGNNSSSTEEESSSGSNPLQQIGQQVLGQLLGNGAGNFGGLASGNAGGLLGNLAGNAGLGTAGATGPVRTNNKTAEQIIAEKNAKEKEEKERAAACAPASTDTAVGKAADDDINAGGSAAKASAGAKAAAAKKAADRKKFGCDITRTGAEVNNPNPVGQGGVTLEEALALEASNECQWGANTEARNKCECASLAKKLAGLDRASTWKTGAQATPGMAPGAIATMDAGGYCDAANRGGRSGCHAAYFLGVFNGEIKVVEQWNSSGGAVVSTWTARKLASYNRIISGQQTAMFHPFNEAPLWIVLNLKPYDMGLLKS